MSSEQKAANNQRRKFLEMIGKAGISSSLLRASPIAMGLMTSRFAEAADAPAKRVFFTFFPGGIIPGTWMPSSLTSMNKSTMALAPSASFCNFYQVDMNGGGHGGAHYALGGRVSKNSLDVLLGQKMGATTNYQRFALGVETGVNSSDVINVVNGGRVAPIDDSTIAFEKLFKAPAAPDQAISAYNKQKTALDTNLAAINAIKTKLGAEEKIRLDAHAAAITKLDENLKKALTVVPLPGCASPVLPSSSEALDRFTKKMRMQIDIGIAALQCGMTNVITLQMSNTQCDWVYDPLNVGQHEAVHGRGANDNIQIVNYQSAQANYILQRLATTKDLVTGANLIDSTVYLQTCDFGDGGGHVTSGAPSILATKMPGFASGSVGGGGSNIALLNKIATGLGYPEVAATFVG